MFPVAPTPHQYNTAPRSKESEHQEIIETRLWIEKHNWLYDLRHSNVNVAPTFRFPDFSSTSVPLIFQFFGIQLVLRSPDIPRRRVSIWRSLNQLLLNLQRSPANRWAVPILLER
ncbi:MAG: hypothetical protein EKK46_04655 [Rhodocyclaceae bacterium]|nr:MAG: hypothetical protein EKK46_04655 [Rhodocyclaceae bacterium]